MHLRENMPYDAEKDEYTCPNGKKSRAKGNRKMQRSKEFLRQREQSLQNITSKKGTLLRMNRSIQAEGAFGIIKQDYGFRQFLLRGNKKVRTEMLLLASTSTSSIIKFSKTALVRSCLRKWPLNR